MSDESEQEREELEEHKQAISAFLDRKGAVSVLCTVHIVQGSRFTDLNDELSISSSTLAKRLEEAFDLDLLERDFESTSYGANRLYQLTGAGEMVREQLRRTGVERLHERIQELEEQFDAQVNQVQQWVREEMYYKM